MDTLLETLDAWKPFRAVVLGDLMLDELVYGEAERLSADAPVPILRVVRTERRPGGAANLCLDLAAMKGEVLMLGVVGDDENGRRLRELLTHAGVDAASLVVDQSRPTTLKQNLIGLAAQRHPQKMFRVDVESLEPVAGAALDALAQHAARIIPGADVVCIEDYGKGVCTPDLCARVIEIARASGVEVLVDPAKIRDYTRYRGATAITPNRNEAELATGMRTCPDANTTINGAVSAKLLDALGLDAVILTLDRHGALLHEREGEPVGVPTRAREVYDVTGAGDMVLAGLAAARANGLSWLDATRLANAAAGLEVEIFGVEPVPIERIRRRLLEEIDPARGKLLSLKEMTLEADRLRRDGRRVVFTNGCFDVLHAGHVTVLDRAREMGDYLVVAINSDASVRALKGDGRPIHTERDRVRVLASMASVDAVMVYETATPIPLLEAIRPDVLVKGGDYAPEQVVGREVVEGYGGRVALIPPVAGLSTTSAVEKAGGGASIRAMD